MRHMFGYELSSSLAALTALTPIPDGTVIVSGNEVRVPKGMANICLAAAMINSATATLRAEIQSPKLRSILNYDISPIKNGLVFGSVPPCARMYDVPLLVDPLEGITVLAQNGAAVMNRAFLEFCDGPISPVNGRIYTIRATAAASLVTASWVNSALTFGQTLVAGHYQVVGMRVWSANLCAARLFFVGGSWRPGVLGGNTEADSDWPDWRFGNSGVWGDFDNTTPPSLDCMGITDTAQSVVLDLVKVS